MDFGFTPEGETERTKWINSLKRVKLNKQEIKDIYQVLKKLRGPHNCVYK